MGKEYTITYRDSEEKYIAFQLFHVDSAAYKKTIRTTQAFFLFVAILGIVYQFMHGFDFIALLAYGILIYMAIAYVAIAERSSSVLIHRANQEVGWTPLTITVTLTDVYIKEEGADGRKFSLVWKNVLRCSETENYFFLQFAGTTAMVLPKHGISCDDELEDVWKFIREKTHNQQ